MIARLLTPLLVLAAAGSAFAQPVVVMVERDKSVIGENQKVTFTFRTTSDYQPTRWRAIGYFSEDPSPVILTSANETQTREVTASRTDVGRKFTACFAAWEQGGAFQAEADAGQAQLTSLLQNRKNKSDQLNSAAARVNAADDRALQELESAQDIARGIVNGGAAGAEKAADEALALGWEQAEQAWMDAQADLEEWRQILDDLAGMDAQIQAHLKSLHTYYVQPAQTAESKMVEVSFMEKETATTNKNCTVRREFVLVRPQNSLGDVRFDSSNADKVSVTQKGSREIAANKADAVTLELKGGATVSGGLRDTEIRIFVGNAPEPVKTMPHTNSEYKDLKLAREYTADEDKACFSYDDFKVEVADKHLVIYLRGLLSPPVSRAMAHRNLRDNLRLEIPVVDDSHDAKPKYVKLQPKRPSEEKNKKEATIEFSEIKDTATTRGDKHRIAVYNGEGSGAGDGLFVTTFAYNGLPHENKDFGTKTVKIRTQSIDGDNAPLTTKELRYFYTFRKQNRPTVPNEPAAADKCINGLWYASAEGAGGSTAVPGFSWPGVAIGNAQYTVATFWAKDGSPGLLAETSLPAATVITLYGGPISKKSSSKEGYGYTFNKTKNIFVPGQQKKVARTINVVVPEKRFGPLLAHLWRHERRHAEQFQGLAGAAGDVDGDGDGVKNNQEAANNTDYTVDATWPGFPISWADKHLDAEIDCEIAAANEMGTPANDWAMDRLNGDPDTRQGTQWTE